MYSSSSHLTIHAGLRLARVLRPDSTESPVFFLGTGSAASAAFSLRSHFTVDLLFKQSCVAALELPSRWLNIAILLGLGGGTCVVQKCRRVVLRTKADCALLIEINSIFQGGELLRKERRRCQGVTVTLFATSLEVDQQLTAVPQGQTNPTGAETVVREWSSTLADDGDEHGEVHRRCKGNGSLLPSKAGEGTEGTKGQ